MFLQIAPYLAGIAIAAAIALIAFGSKRLALLPSVAKVKAAYPIINVALMTIAQATNGSPYDYLFDAAAAVWGGPGISNAESAKLVEAAISHFSKSKYAGTNIQDLDPAKVEQGRAIAEELLAKYKNV